jgi:hypothetical protein
LLPTETNPTFSSSLTKRKMARNPAMAKNTSTAKSELLAVSPGAVATKPRLKNPTISRGLEMPETWIRNQRECPCCFILLEKRG